VARAQWQGTADYRENMATGFLDRRIWLMTIMAILWRDLYDVYIWLARIRGDYLPSIRRLIDDLLPCMTWCRSNGAIGCFLSVFLLRVNWEFKWYRGKVPSPSENRSVQTAFLWEKTYPICVAYRIPMN
jgi:hypothetical protein